MNSIKIQLVERGVNTSRWAANSPIRQGADEDLYHVIETEGWGSSDSLPVSTPTVTVTNQDGTAVTATICPDAASVVNSTVIQYRVKSVTAGERYTVKVVFTVNSRIASCLYYLDGEE